MKHRIFFLKIIFVLNQLLYCAADNFGQAICIVPITDLVGLPFEFILPQANIPEHYEKIPVSGEKGFLACHRLHQLLFNEKVEIINEYNYEAEIKISSVFNQTPKTDAKNCTYFVLKNHLMKLDKLNPLQINLIPAAIDFNITDFEIPEKNIVTLVLPYFQKSSKQTFSVGTRFVTTNKDDETYTIAIYDQTTNTFLHEKIDKRLAIEPISLTKEERIKQFVNLLNLWSSFEKKIPYIWGGISMRNFESHGNYHLIEKLNHLGHKILYYINEQLEKIPFSGFDCSGLIARAAQICQIPYFFKNTTTLEKNLKPLDETGRITNGDLIWFPGHVIIISDVETNNCIEARGYSSGYGIIHKIKINKLFKNINTIEDLKSAFFNKKPIELINKFDQVTLTINKFKILKLDSVWPSK